MILVWFIYGLAFFALGLVILVYPKKGSQFELARDIWMIGAFGIVHGVNEWLDMFIDIGGPLSVEFMKTTRLLTLSGSFLFLLYFGITVVSKHSRMPHWPRVLVPVFGLGWLAVVVATGPHARRLLFGDISARYILCAPGAFLTALGLLLQVPKLKAAKLSAISKSLTVAAVTFLAYGVFAGLIVKKAGFFPASWLNYDAFVSLTGFPVQIMRAVCAIVLAGAFIHVLGVFRWETQEALRTSELRCGTIASALPVFLFMVDRDLVVTFVEGKGLRGLGLRPEQLLGRRVAEAFPCGNDFTQACERASAGEEFMTTTCLDGVILETYYSALRDPTGQVAYVVAVALDVSAQTKVQQELEAYQRTMEKHARQAAVGVLGSTMAQQIAEPLSVTRLRLQKAVEDLAPSASQSTVREDIKKSLREVARVREVLERFMRAAQVQRETTAQPIGLYQIARRMVEVFAQSAQRRRVAITVRDMDLVPLMSISSHELEQVFYHVIQRALDAADPETQQELTMSCSADEQCVDLLFSDTCGGTVPGRVDDAFDRLFEDPECAAGVGLGLAVVQRIVTGHGGEITVEGGPGKNTTFRIRLPAKRVY